MSVKKRYFRKIEKHPDFEEIDKRIKEGESPLHLAGETQNRYPGDKSKQLASDMLYEYRKQEYPELANVTKQDEMKSEIDIGLRLMVLTGKEPPPPEPRRFIDDKTLLSWTNGVEGFSQFVDDMIIERGIHIELQDYQKDIAEAFLNYTRVTVCTGGQVGKDLMILTFSVWLALTNPGSSQLVICSTQNQSIGLMDRTMENINMDSELAETVSKVFRKPEAIIFFKNKSRIYYLTAKSRIAGKTNILCAWINEARDIREEEVTRVTPLLGIAGGKLFVLSRPRFRRGYFWDMFIECQNNPRFKAFQIPTIQNKYFNKQVYEDDLATLSPDLFKIEYLGEFADAGSSYFSEDAINKCSRSEYDYKAMEPEPEYEYSLGIDWARLRDTCVLIVIGKRIKQEKGEPDYKMLHLFSFSPEGGEPSTFEHHFAYIQMLDNRFNFRYIIPESSGMGIPLSDRLKDLWDRNRHSGVVKPYENRSLNSKMEMYENTKHVIETGDIMLPRNADRLLNELKMTQFGTTLHGTIKVETPITDDYADALCLALMAWKRPFEIGISTVKIPGPKPSIIRT